jgi:signal transduction histidine kinase
VTICIEIIKKDSLRYIQLSVVDTGIGIAEEDQNKLFHLFGFL